MQGINTKSCGQNTVADCELHSSQDACHCRAVLLMTKRDLADLCLEGLLESTEQQQQDQLAALLQVCIQHLNHLHERSGDNLK